uniref:Embryo surrounding factor 1 brassicaceae domain-containing protein n=1 Tax=Zea mays TaxID=4577 RepID=A0A804P372_MAIZE
MVILLAVLLALFLSPAECEGDDAAGGHRWLPGRKEMTERSRITIRLCVRQFCGSGTHWETCYCCAVLPGNPCELDQKRCWDTCPGAQPHQLLPAPAPAAEAEAEAEAGSPGDFT